MSVDSLLCETDIPGRRFGNRGLARPVKNHECPDEVRPAESSCWIGQYVFSGFAIGQHGTTICFASAMLAIMSTSCLVPAAATIRFLCHRPRPLRCFRSSRNQFRQQEWNVQTQR